MLKIKKKKYFASTSHWRDNLSRQNVVKWYMARCSQHQRSSFASSFSFWKSKRCVLGNLSFLLNSKKISLLQYIYPFCNCMRPTLSVAERLFRAVACWGAISKRKTFQSVDNSISQANCNVMRHIACTVNVPTSSQPSPLSKLNCSCMDVRFIV